MGIEPKIPNNDKDDMFGILTEIYQKMGHMLSSQYAGSLARKQSIQDSRSKVNKFIDKFPEIFNTFKRYFNNSFNDQYKQSSINLFLGKFIPLEHKLKLGCELWQLTSDVILHKLGRDVKLAM